ncbi:acylneuraminate cytidylyltransferase family protein [Gammaproteobacteria bacterium]|nr:acylneuraminate cytidylyltransferase family protein [Gammaproteobacteria bacterium]
MAIPGRGLVNLNILGITLARGGSKGVKRKNIKDLLGKPLIQYTIDEALESKFLDEYIISTDDQEIANVAESLGAEAPFLRPDDLSTDQASSASALKHAVSFMEKRESKKYDYIVELMCTNPLKLSCDIDAAIKKLFETNADSVIAVHELEDHHPARIKKIVNDKITDFAVKEPNEARRQDLKPKAYVRSGSIYCMKRDYLMKDGKRYGGTNSRPYILPSERAINVDTETDFLVAEIMMSKQ